MTKSIFSNTSTNILVYIIKFIVSFITRKLLISYLGIEILGVNSVIVETIQMISLLELGIQSVIIFRLYSPIAQKDIGRENRMYNVLVNAYKTVGVIVLTVGLLISSIIYPICNTELPKSTVYIIYFIQLIIAAVNYFITCPRILLLAHQKQFLCNMIDCLVLVITFVLQIISIVTIKSYYLFIICSFVQAAISNTVIYFFVKRQFSPVIKKCDFDKPTFKVVLDDLKHIVVGKLATFIYASTDNIVISIFCGSITVGIISNYKLIINAFRSLCESYHTAITPIFGNFFALDKSEIKVTEVVLLYTIFQFFVSCVTLIPLYCLISDIIYVWIGQEFAISNNLIFLMVMDNFMNNMEQPCVLISGCFGYFSQDKWVSSLAAIANITFSVLLAMKYGSIGVLIGTIIAMTIFWSGRSYYVFKNIYKSYKKILARYWLLILALIGSFIALLELFKYTCGMIAIRNEVLGIFVHAIIIEIILLPFFLIVFFKIPITRKHLKKFVHNLFERRSFLYNSNIGF